MTRTIDITLTVWRQSGPNVKGRLDTYIANNISTDMSFLEMLDVVNEQLTEDGKEPIAFDHDCREGICGMCGAVVNGRPHGPEKGTTLCQLHMRHFSDGDTIVVEPWRARAFKAIKDLVVDRGALDTLIQAGGYISANTGGAQDANAILIPAEHIQAILDTFKKLRTADENIYLRSASINLYNGMISLTFSCDGTHYMPYEEFLQKNTEFWFGAAA